MRLSDIKSDAGWTLPDWPALMGVRTAAAYLDLPEASIWHLLRDGELRGQLIGKRRQIARAELDAYIEHIRAPAAKPARLKLTERR